MSREAMKELVKASEKCTDETIGKWLSDYEKSCLDKERHLLFDEHVIECLHCMALYNIETKHKYGYIDNERTGARRIKVMLLELMPSRKHIFAALSVLLVAVSLSITQIGTLSPQKTGNSPNKHFSESNVQKGLEGNKAEEGDWRRIKEINLADNSANTSKLPSKSPTPRNISDQIDRKLDHGDSGSDSSCERLDIFNKQDPKVKPILVADKRIPPSKDVNKAIKLPGNISEETEKSADIPSPNVMTKTVDERNKEKEQLKLLGGKESDS